MPIHQSIEWGKNHLRNISRRLFGTAPEELNNNLEHVLSFPTGAHREPLEIHVKLFKLPDSWGSDAWRMTLNTDNARHPYDEHNRSGYFGTEAMNPALLTALVHIDDTLVSLEKKILQEAQHNGQKSNVRMNTNGPELWLTFNTKDSGYLKAPQTKILALYKQAIALFEKERPVIQKHIDQSAVLQPSPNPDAETILAFDMMISDAIVRGLSGMPGHNPHTTYVLKDGTHKRLIKGPE